ncbi:transposase [Micromonospora sp. B11E3]|uniref:RNA-guided endonuclease InsQ/TnpB family protein n=1 Tax=Micromonospora sp. B11E3 TaxID=3153562 RepID=UPI00325F407F
MGPVRTAYRCRAYPTPEQAAVLNRTFGCVRVVWNRTLAARHARWRTERKSTSYPETDRALTEMKKQPDLAFLAEVSSVPLQQTLRHQHTAMTAFFAKRARYPRYKSRHGRQSASFTRSGFRLRGGNLSLGDLGLTDFAVLSTGERIPHPRHMERRERRLRRYQRIMARKQKGSANRSLARSISRTGWAEFRNLLTYKAHRDGRTLAVVDRWYPSSKTCSACGRLLATLSLGTRHWPCPRCGTRHHRDVNAAKNIAVAAGLAETQNACGADVRHEGPPSAQSAVNQEPQPARVGIPRL